MGTSKTSILFLLLFFTILCPAQKFQEDGKKDLQAAVKAANTGDTDAFVYNLTLFSNRIEDQNITPEKLPKENLDLYTDALYIAAVKKLNIPDGIAKKSIDFLNYEIEEKPNNMYAMGNLYLLGAGVSKNFATAMYWYEKSADGGNIGAMSICAYYYSELKDYTKTLFWIEKLINSIDDKELKIQNMINISIMYTRGLVGTGGTTQNYDKAIYWIERAIENGYDITADVEKATDFAKLYEKNQNYGKARYWYEKSADKGDTTALFALANIYRHGFGVTTNMEIAQNYYEKGCKCKIEKMTKTSIKFK